VESIIPLEGISVFYFNRKEALRRRKDRNEIKEFTSRTLRNP